MRFPIWRRLPLILLSLSPLVHSQCTLKIPGDPLTACGLATPFELTGCNQLDFANEGVFVEASIIDPTTGHIEIYHPLVINAGMTRVTDECKATKKPASGDTAGFFISPIMPTIPGNGVVALWFGSNANNVTLTGDTKTCVNGLGDSVFGQFAHCNAPAWFSAANAAVRNGLLKVPRPGTGLSGQACPTTRDFRIVDQDQSDNVDTTYLLIRNNTLAQHTPEHAKDNPDADVLSNSSDNALVNKFIQPALNCTPYESHCKTCPTGQASSLSTNELQASLFPPIDGPALVPLNDPMTLLDGQQSLPKVNLYRAGVGQPIADENNASGTTYCQQFAQAGLFISSNQHIFNSSASPAPDQATDLFSFLAMRFSASFGPEPGLDCTKVLNVSNPVILTTNKEGVVTTAEINTNTLQQILRGLSSSAVASASHAPNRATGNRFIKPNLLSRHKSFESPWSRPIKGISPYPVRKLFRKSRLSGGFS